MQLILDLGSGRSTMNDHRYACAIIDSIKAVDSGKHEIILKYQLFKSEPPNVPLDQLVFDAAYTHGRELGYQVTASVFDKPSLDFLLHYEVPFIKVACRPDKYWLIGEIPRKIKVYASVKPGTATTDSAPFVADRVMCCISKYPAEVKDYTDFDAVRMSFAISDHTVGWEMLKRNPQVLEKHYVMDRDPENPDSGPFAVDQAQLKEIM